MLLRLILGALHANGGVIRHRGRGGGCTVGTWLVESRMVCPSVGITETERGPKAASASETSIRSQSFV